jgi:hypothetical protein
VLPRLVNSTLQSQAAHFSSRKFLWDHPRFFSTRVTPRLALLRSFVVLCIKSVSQLFYNQPLPHSFSKMPGCHPVAQQFPLWNSPPSSAKIVALSFHALTNASSRNSLCCTSLQMPRGWGTSIGSQPKDLNLCLAKSFTMRRSEKSAHNSFRMRSSIFLGLKVL